MRLYKKLLMSFLVLVLTFTTMASSQLFAAECLDSTQHYSEDKNSFKAEIQQKKMVAEVVSYVKVSDEGTLYLDNVPEDLYVKYDLHELENHFTYLNTFAEDEYYYK
jgi:hypothetical protein